MGVVDRLEDWALDGVPEGLVPMGATVAPDDPGFEPGARSRGGEPPVGLDVLVRLWLPTALSKTLLVGPVVWGLEVLGLGSTGADVGPTADPGVPASPPEVRPTPS